MIQRRIYLGTVLAAALLVGTVHAQRVQFPSSVPEQSPYTNTPGPAASLEGTIQPQWDPYAPNTGQALGGPIYSSPATAYPSTICPPDPIGGCYIQPDGTLAQPQRLLQSIDFEYTWLAGDGGDDLGVNDLEISASFGFPFFYNAAPIVVTPGFAVHYFDGPSTTTPPFLALPGVISPDLPPRVFDAYLDVGWQPVITPWLAADLGARIGVYSDFQAVNTDSIRLMGRGLAVFTWSPTLQIAAGALYVDRNNIKLLPAGGVIWTPNPDTRFDILFPHPKLAQRWTTVGNVEWWWYVAGEYGGGAWTIERRNGAKDAVDYNDLRVILGLEWRHLVRLGLTGHFEVGYVFDREIEYVSLTPDFNPDDTVMLRAGVSF